MTARPRREVTTMKKVLVLLVLVVIGLVIAKQISEN
jgi:hypothetical protein